VSTHTDLCEQAESFKHSIVVWLLRVQRSAKLGTSRKYTARLLHLQAWIQSVPHHEVEQKTLGIVMCTTHQTCRLHVLTLTTITANGFQDIQNTLAAQIKIHLLLKRGHLPMLSLAVLPNATPQELPLCPTPYQNHHTRLLHWLQCMSMSLHIIWASVHSHTSDVAMTWSGTVSSSVKKLAQMHSRRLSSCCIAYLVCNGRGFELYINMLGYCSDFLHSQCTWVGPHHHVDQVTCLEPLHSSCLYLACGFAI